MHFELAKAENSADLSHMVSYMHEVTGRVDKLEKDIAHNVENLEEDTRSKRESETRVAHEIEHHCVAKGPSTPLGSFHEVVFTGLGGELR